MIRPLPHQQALLRNLDEVLRRWGRQAPPSVLIVAPHGWGKRSCAALLAQRLGVQLASIDDGAIARDGLGLSGTSDAVLLAQGIDGFSQRGRDVLLGLCKTRSHRQPGSPAWRRLPDDVLIVGTYNGSLNACSADALPRYFDVTVELTWPERDEELVSLVDLLVGGRSVDVRASADCSEFVRLPPLGGVRTLDSWIHRTLSAGTSDVDAAALEAAATGDLLSTLSNVEYRGEGLEPAAVGEWLAQFPQGLRTTAFTVAGAIARTYHYSPSRVLRAYRRAIESGPASGTPVVCAKWQDDGKSAPSAVYDVIKVAGWRRVGNIELKSPSSWPDSLPDGVRTVVLADDFVGTGDTLASIGSAPDDYLGALLARYPEVCVLAVVAIGTMSALTFVRGSWPQSERLTLFCADMLSERDTCFSSHSRILEHAASRAGLRDFCLNAPPLGCGKLGYLGSGLLVVFPHTVPDNTLPIIWETSAKWRALFPCER